MTSRTSRFSQEDIEEILSQIANDPGLQQRFLQALRLDERSLERTIRRILKERERGFGGSSH